MQADAEAWLILASFWLLYTTAFRAGAAALTATPGDARLLGLTSARMGRRDDGGPRGGKRTADGRAKARVF